MNTSVHPSLFLGRLTIDELRQRLASPAQASVWQAMNARWQAAAAEDADGKIRFVYSCGCSRVTPGLVEAALAWVLAADAAALAHVQAQIDKLGRIYANPPQSFKELSGGRNTYFSNVEAGIAVRLCGAAVGAARLDTLPRLARQYWIDDHNHHDQIMYHGVGHNIPFTRLLSAASCALLLGEDCGHPGWQRVVDLAADACHLFGRWGFDEQGVSYEAATYGYAVAGPLYQFAEMLLHSGAQDLYQTLPLLRKFPDAMALMHLPARDGVPSYSDSHGLACNNPMPWLNLTAARFQRPEHLALWHETGGPQHGIWPCLLWWDGAPAPAPLESFNLPTAFHAPGPALACMRSSWGRDAVFVSIVGQGRSHSAPGHNHADAGHFSIQAGGEHLAIDSGYWNYNEDQHSVMLVDGKGHIVSPEGWYAMQPLAGRLAHFRRHRLLDYAMVEAGGAKGCVWADRHFLFVRLGADAAYLVVIDNINPDNSAHSFLWQLQARPGCEIAITDAQRAVVSGARARLDCTFIPPLPDDYPSHPHSLKLGQDLKAGAEPADRRLSRPRLLAELEGLNGQLMTVIVPRLAGAPSLVVRPANRRRVFRVEIDCGEFTDTVISALDHGWLDEPGLPKFAELAVVRRDRQGNELDRWLL